MADFVLSVVPSSGFTRTQDGVGMRFTNTTGTNVTITELARWKMSGNTMTHAVGIYTSTTFSSPIRTVTVDMAGGTAGTFVYGSITPYDVPAGATIYIISTETPTTGDYYLTQHPNGSGGYISNILTITDIGTVSSAFSNAGTGTIENGGNNGGSATAFGPVAFRYSGPLPTWTKNGNVYDTDGQYYQISNAMADAVSGDVVEVNGNATWGIGGTYITVKDGVTLRGEGSATTVITQSTSAPAGSYGAGLIRLNSNSAVIGMELVGSTSAISTAFSIVSTTSTDWRISDIKLTPTVGRLFMFYNNLAGSQTGTTECRGLIDRCDITPYDSQTELIYSRGLLTAWDSASGAGDGNAIYVEYNTFRGALDGSAAYICDANANAKIVVRNNLIVGKLKVDGHGLSSNTPNQSCRRIEAYWNTYTSNGTGWSAFELRGGSNFIWNNTAVTTAAAFSMRDYGCINQNTQFGDVYQTPSNYPLGYQIGTGARTTINVEDVVAYQMVRIKTLGDTNWAAMGGSATPAVNDQFIATGAGSGTGDVYITPATEPAYVWGNTINGNPWARTLGTLGAGTLSTNNAGYSIGATSIGTQSSSTVIAAGNYVSFSGQTTRYRLTATRNAGSQTLQISPPLVSAIPASNTTVTYGAVTNYQGQTANSSATFTDNDIIQSNRNVFSDTGFGALTGVVVGTVIGSAGSAVGKTGQGYWAADEGSWNTQNAVVGTPGYQKGNGRLYVSNGTTWDLYYTPYTYPHPLTESNPTQVSATINSAGNVLTVVWSEAVENGADGGNGLTLSATGGAVTANYSSGSGSSTYVYNLNRSIGSGESVTNSYTQPGDGIKSVATDFVVLSFSGSAVTNSSTINAGQSSTIRNPAALGGGF